MTETERLTAELAKAMQVIDLADQCNDRLMAENQFLRGEIGKLKSQSAGLQMQMLHLARVVGGKA